MTFAPTVVSVDHWRARLRAVDGLRQRYKNRVSVDHWRARLRAGTTEGKVAARLLVSVDHWRARLRAHASRDAAQDALYVSVDHWRARLRAIRISDLGHRVSMCQSIIGALACAPSASATWGTESACVSRSLARSPARR